MKRLALLNVICLLAMMGCNTGNYAWNENARKAGEGRCQEVKKDGTLGQFVASEKCGR